MAKKNGGGRDYKAGASTLGKSAAYGPNARPAMQAKGPARPATMQGGARKGR